MGGGGRKKRGGRRKGCIRILIRIFIVPVLVYKDIYLTVGNRINNRSYVPISNFTFPVTTGILLHSH